MGALTPAAPNVAAMAVAVLCSSATFWRSAMSAAAAGSLAGLAKVTFGIYLVHDCFITLFPPFRPHRPSHPPVAAVPLMTALVFLCSFAAAWVIGRIPFVGKYLT